MDLKFYITGTRRGLGKALAEKYHTVNNMKECDVFINCKHDGFEQVELLYKAAFMDKQIINIGSTASEWIKGYKPSFRYGLEKSALRQANEQLYWQGVRTTILNLGYFDTERSAGIDKPKMSLEYVVDLIDWVLDQPYAVKEVTVAPHRKNTGKTK